MRYPVTDEFAIAFGEVLTSTCCGRRQPVDVAVARARRRLPGRCRRRRGPRCRWRRRGCSGRGRRGCGWRCRAGSRCWTRPEADGADLPGPSEPSGSSGRAAAMARASAALAPGSGRTGVLLHGMAGAGKTACALELAYRHQDRFAAAAFWQAPTRDDEFGGRAGRPGGPLETQLGGYGFAMAGHIGTVAAADGVPAPAAAGSWRTAACCSCWTTWKRC